MGQHINIFELRYDFVFLCPSACQLLGRPTTMCHNNNLGRGNLPSSFGGSFGFHIFGGQLRVAIGRSTCGSTLQGVHLGNNPPFQAEAASAWPGEWSAVLADDTLPSYMWHLRRWPLGDAKTCISLWRAERCGSKKCPRHPTIHALGIAQDRRMDCPAVRQAAMRETRAVN